MRLAQLLRPAGRVVFFTGAGASTEPPTSIPDFRSANGLWKDEELMAALSREHFFADPEGFWSLFRGIFLPWTRAEPNLVHRAPARLAALGKHVAVVTQNIDGLDRRCSTGHPVFELHGNLRGSTCPRCGRRTAYEDYPESGAPRCACGSPLKPDVVLFGDPLDLRGALLPARDQISRADLLVVVGTSLSVAPANGLVLERRDGAPMVIVNRDPTPYDRDAALVIRQTAGPVLDEAIAELESGS